MYSDLFMMTVALPLSAGFMIMFLSFLRDFKADFSGLVRLHGPFFKSSSQISSLRFFRSFTRSGCNNKSLGDQSDFSVKSLELSVRLLLLL